MLKSVTFRSTLAAVAWAISLSVYAMANGPTQVDIPAGNLVPALEALEKQAAIELVFQPEQLKSFHTSGVKGTYEPKDAVRLLLKGTPLELRTDPTGAMVIVPSHTAVSGAQAQSQAAADSERAADSRSSLQLAQTNSGQAAGPVSVADQQPAKAQHSSEPVVLQEVIVTAQKRRERIQDVPVPVTAIDAQALTDSNLLSLQDYYTSVPGLQVNPTPYGSPQIVIRGLSTGVVTNPTVGVVVDDVPYGSTTTAGLGETVPDIDPSDLARVEVLRGPQGTLYGASSIGGLLKYVTIDPSTAAVNGRVQAGLSDVYNGAKLGYSVRGSVNVPLNDALAIRASAFTREDPGYIDNPVSHTDGINKVVVDGGRIAALWRPSNEVSLRVSALYQDTTGHGLSEVEQPTAGVPQTTGLNGLQQNFLAGTGTYDRTIEAYSAILSARLGSVDLTAISGYSVNKISVVTDYTPGFGGLAQAFFPGSGGAQGPQGGTTDKFTQELRISGAIDQRFDWLLGAFYNHEKAPFVTDLNAANLNTGQVVGSILTFANGFKLTEYAGFANLTYHFTDRFDVQIGGRESHNTQDSTVTYTGFISSYSEAKSNDRSFTYLATPRFKIASDLMVYARVASGYQPGGANVASVLNGAPLTYGPDTSTNYEVGTKGEFINHSLSVDASIYYIRWNDLQLGLSTPQGLQYIGNASAAKSEGVEFSVTSRPLTNLTITGWVAVGEAELTQNYVTQSPSGPRTVAYAGNRLPNSSRFSGYLSLRQEFPIRDGWAGFLEGVESYQGDRPSDFETGSPTVFILPAYARTDVLAGVKSDSWTANLFVTNLTDRRGLLSGGFGPPITNTYIQPRTVGLSIVKAF